MNHTYEKPDLYWKELYMEGFICSSLDFEVQVDEFQFIDEENVDA